ncbi:hypothetical protein [Micromonospora avicenniae]|nr:hypothetical protein [Micromonospora avicenniae]
MLTVGGRIHAYDPTARVVSDGHRAERSCSRDGDDTTARYLSAGA